MDPFIDQVGLSEAVEIIAFCLIDTHFETDFLADLHGNLWKQMEETVRLLP